MRKELFQPSVEGEARLLLLIDSFSGGTKSLEGRTKLAKLDFLLRYPEFLERAINIRSLTKKIPASDLEFAESQERYRDIEHRMVRYRYGPWDPAYFGLIGRLIGKGLVKPKSMRKGIGYRTTEKGRSLAKLLETDGYWYETSQRTKLLRKHFDLTGTTLKKFIYQYFPEVTSAQWGESI